MRKRGFQSIQRKFHSFSIVLTAGLLAVFFIMQQLEQRYQENSAAVSDHYNRFARYWNKMQEADRTLYSYAQTPVKEQKEVCREQLEELMEHASVLSGVQKAPEMQDLRRLTEKYLDSGKQILDDNAGTEERAARYNTLTGYKWILDGLYDTLYQEMQEYLETEQKTLAQMRRNLNIGVMLLEALLLALIVLWLRRLAKKITWPVQELTMQTEEIISGNRRIEMRYHPEIRDELDILNNSFYRMVETNNRNYDSLKKQKELEERLSRTRLRLLQSRVNPHFMFNTLNLIAGLAAEEEAEKTTDMVIQTARYLRYALVCLDKAVRLEDEAGHAKDYMKIQKARFEERFELEFQMEEESKNAVVPSMILQPLCENALGYGMESMKRTTVIRICAGVKAGRLTVAVEDNGAGMKAERLQEIRGRLEHADSYDDTEGIGIVNTYQRLQSFFRAIKGDMDGGVAFELESEPQVCTRIAFTMPLIDMAPSKAQEMLPDEGGKE